MLPNSYIKVSYTLIIIRFIADFTLKFISDTRCELFRNAIIKTKSVC